MADTRIYAIAIYEILKNFSDENHILSNTEIINLLKITYNIEMNHRTVINNIESLITFGIDISVYADNRKGYYLIDRDFEDSEIDLLCNCIHSSHFIPEKASNELITKLTDKQSKFKRSKFKNQVYINNTKKTKNKEIMLNIEILSEAIEKRKAITFMYLQYNEDKKLIPKRDKDYCVFPYYIIQENNNLYLICKNPKYENIAHYRIDKMTNIRLSEITIPVLKQNFDPYDYAKHKKFMFSDEEKNIYLRCHKRMLDDVIDQFGQEISIQKDVKNPEYYFIHMTSSPQGIIYFALQYLNFCEILKPESLRNEIKHILEERIKIYNK